MTRRLGPHGFPTTLQQMLSGSPWEHLKVKEMDVTTTRIGRYLWSAALVSLALASFYGMVWVIWDL